MSMQLTLAWRYLRGRAARSILTLLAVVLGVMIVFGMNGIVPAVRASFDAGVRSSEHQVDLIVTPLEDRTFPAAVADTVLGTPGVAAVTPVLERLVRLPEAYRLPVAEGPSIDALVVNGWEPASSEAVIPILPVAGRWLAAGETDTMLILESLARRTGLGLGDTIRLPGAAGERAFTIVGVLPERPIFGDEEVSIPLAAAQALHGLPGQINAVAAQTAPEADVEAVRRAVEARIGPGYRLGTVESGGEEWEAVLRIAEVVFTLFGVLALAMGGFIIVNTFRTSVAERRRDIGVLRALGASRRVVLGIMLAEGLLLGAAGTAIGMLAGGLAVGGLLPLLSPQWERFFGAPLGAPAFAPPIVALTLVLGLGVPLLSALLPARAASRVTPLEALRPAAPEAGRAGEQRGAIWGAALVALALLSVFTGQPRLVALGALLFLVGLVLASGAMIRPLAGLLGRAIGSALPREGLLAERSLHRNPGRAAVTVSAMMLSTAALVALAGLATTFTQGLLGYLEESMQADYLLLPEALVLGQAGPGVGPEVAERLRATPGIAAVTTLRRGEGRLDGEATQVIGIDPLTYPQLAGLAFAQGEPATAFGSVGRGGLIVNSFLAARKGLTVGQEVTLETPQGPRSYTVSGVGTDYLNSRVATVYIAQAELAADFGVTSDVLLMADRAEGAAPAEVERALLELLREAPGFSLLSFERWRESQVEANQTRTNVMYILMAVLAVPAVLALANTLGIGVLERTREIGMLRAVGMARGQVRRLILAESLLLALTGAALGVLAGVWLGYSLVSVLGSAGLQFRYIFPGVGVALALGVGLLFGVLAALAPAQRAARLSPSGALRYE